MQFSRLQNLLPVCVIALLFAGCVSREESTVDSNTLRPNINTNFNSNAANANANTAQDDEIELDKLVDLPFTPEETVWRTDKVVADANTNVNTSDVSNGSTLTAVLKFSEKDSAAIVSDTKGKSPVSVTELETETWFPAELIAKTETSGNSTIKGKIYSAEGFYKAPYKMGSLVRIDDTNYFVLKLRTR